MHDKFSHLRKRAEKILKSGPTSFSPTEEIADLARVLQELDTYRVELELQNEELTKANQELQQVEDALKNEIAIHNRHYEIAPVGYVTLNIKNNIVELNQTLATLLGLNKTKIIHQLFTSFINPEDQDSFYFFRQCLLDTQEAQNCELRLITRQSQPCWVKLDAKLEIMQQDIHLHIAVSDISHLKILQDDLLLAGAIFKECSEAIMVTDAARKIIKVNQAFTEITGYAEHEVMGKNPRLLQSDKHDAFFYQKMWAEINHKLHWRGEIWNKRKNGELYPEWLSITALKNSADQVIHYFSISSDLTEHKNSEAHIHYMAYYDPLTQLPNRCLLKDHIELALAQAQRNKTHGALLILDLDHFKVINDSLGHLVGDELLIETAKRLQHHIREEDTISRLGGDEFVVLLTDLSKDKQAAIVQASQIAKKIQTQLTETVVTGEYDLQITVSIGIALYPTDANDMTNLIKLADNALYKAKE